MSDRRTKRRYAHELYPHAEDGQTRPLAVEVPYLYARAIGFEMLGTGWMSVEPRTVAGNRTQMLVESRRLAFTADALLQGMTGDEAWSWADRYTCEESGELVNERADHYGVDPSEIKPYPCGPEPDRHPHYGEPDARGIRWGSYVQGAESECEVCTEPTDPEPTS